MCVFPYHALCPAPSSSSYSTPPSYSSTIPLLSIPPATPSVSTLSPFIQHTQPALSSPVSTAPSPLPDSQSFATSIIPMPVPNERPMLTRSKTGSLKPCLFLAHVEPHTVKQALS